MAAIVVAVEDRGQASTLRRILESDGHRVSVAHSGRVALDRARRAADLLVLDVALPRDVLLTVRRESALPVLMVSARDDEDDEVISLGLGADDFLVVPAGPRRLTARVRSLLRRAATPPAPHQVRQVGPLAVDPVRHEVEVAGRPVDCTRAEVAILAAMSAQAERVFTRGELIDAIGGIDPYSGERLIDQHMLKLRRKIETNPRRPALLVTVYGIGYKLTAQRA